MKTLIAFLPGLIAVLAGLSLILLLRGVGVAAGVVFVIGGLFHMLMVHSRPEDQRGSRHHVPHD